MRRPRPHLGAGAYVRFSSLKSSRLGETLGHGAGRPCRRGFSSLKSSRLGETSDPPTMVLFRSTFQFSQVESFG